MDKKQLTIFVPLASTSLLAAYKFLYDYFYPIFGLFIVYLIIDREQTQINAKIKYHKVKDKIKGIKNGIKRRKLKKQKTLQE